MDSRVLKLLSLWRQGLITAQEGMTEIDAIVNEVYSPRY